MKRRQFFTNTFLGYIPFFDSIRYLSDLFNINEEDFDKLIGDDGFHFFDDSLANLHFYFINVVFKGNSIVKKISNGKSFMIVRLPQQHLTEKSLKGVEMNKVGESRLSGFSYLAFEILPFNQDTTGDNHSKIPFKIKNLLDWNNRNYFKLMISDKLKKFSSESFEDAEHFKKNNEMQVSYGPDSSNLSFYKNVCEKVFDSAEKIPITILEIPQGIFLTPYINAKKEIKAGEIKEDISVKLKNSNIDKRYYIFNAENRKIHRSIRELWNASMFFEKVLTTQNVDTSKNLNKEETIFRAVAYSADEKSSEPNPDEVWIPGFMEKQEIVYMTSLGRKKENAESLNKDPSHDIRAERLYFTGLGVSAKFYFRYDTPPNGISLIEYEHHISLGRDEYVKVTHIGILSSGNKAEFTQIGRRKIKDGIAYVNYEKYIKPLAGPINFYNPLLFKNDEQYLVTGELPNYINARKKNDIDDSGITHSESGGFSDAILATAINLREVKSETHFRRYPFISVEITNIKNIQINIENVIGTPQNPLVFWPKLWNENENENEKAKEKDLYFDFRGKDWSEREIFYKAPVLFISKKVIDLQKEDDFFKIFSNYFQGNDGADKSYRRKIYLNSQSIAYTNDYIPNEVKKDGTKIEIFPNKSNVVATEFIEQYFNLAIKTNDFSKDESVFNVCFFPLFPQVRRAKVFIDNINSFSTKALPSIIEYNDEYIKYAFKRGNSSKLKTIEGNLIPVNKAKLIFDFTSNFLENSDKDLMGGYENIQQALSKSTEQIGGLVNPDIQIESVGLIKQGVLASKLLNKKYEDVRDSAGNILDKIIEFNPRDLLKGKSAEIFGGIDLFEILEEIMPEKSAPLTEIRNFTNRIEDLGNLTVINNIKKFAQELQRKINDVDLKLKEIEAEITRNKINLTDIEEKLNKRFYFKEVYILINKFIEEGRLLYFLEYNQVDYKISVKEREIGNYISNELVSNIDKIIEFNNWLIKFVPISIDKARQAEINSLFDNLKEVTLTYLNEEKFYVRINGYPEYNRLFEIVMLLQKQSEAKVIKYRSQVSELSKWYKGLENGSELFIQISSIYEVLMKMQTAYYVELMLNLQVDIKNLIDKLPGNQNGVYTVNDIIGTNRTKVMQLKDSILAIVTTNISEVNLIYENNRSDYLMLSKLLNNKVKEKNDIINKLNEDYLTKIPFMGEIFKDYKSISDIVEDRKNKYQLKLYDYEDLIRQQLKNGADSIFDKLNNLIAEWQNKLLKSIDEKEIEEYKNNIVEARRIMQIIFSPSRKEIYYKWNTNNFKDTNLGMIEFKRYGSPPTEMVINVKNTVFFDIEKYPPIISKVEYIAENSIKNFGINFFKIIFIKFQEVSFRKGTNMPTKFEVKIADIQFGGAFSFLQVFESYISNLLGDAFRLKYYPDAVNIGYTLAIPNIKTPSFNFFNLTLNLDFWLHFNKQPMELTFSFARPENKFGVVVGVYAGFGYFSFTAESKHGITAMEVALEFGGYFGLSFGPLRGEVKMAVGLYYRKDKNGVTIEGYFIVEGSARIWIVMVGVRFYMGIKSQGNYVEGRCTVTYSIRLGRFFKRSFSATYYKKLAGATPANNQNNQQNSKSAISSISTSSNQKLSSGEEIKFLEKDYYNQYIRHVEEMDLNQWKEYLNSYI